MKKYIFIVNPVAGKGKGIKLISTIQESFTRENIKYSIEVTKYKGHGEILAKKAVENGYNHIVSVGGDGTIYEVLNGIKGKKVILGILPSGTGNDFARSIGLPKDIKKCIEVLKSANTERVDIGKVNNRYFINIASVGIDAEITKETEKYKKYFKGTSAYILGVFKVLTKSTSKKVTLIIDGKKFIRDIELIAIGNGKYYGGGMKINPWAELGDGKLDICLVNKINRIKLATLFPTVFRGKHTKIKDVESFQGSNIKIISKNPILLNADGDIIGTTPAHISLEKKSIEIIFPKEYANEKKDSKDIKDGTIEKKVMDISLGS